MKKLSIAVLVALALFTLAGCGLLGMSIDPVVGKWQTAGVFQKEFKADGSMTDTTWILTTTGTWTHTGDSLTQTPSVGVATTTTVIFSADKGTMTLGSPIGLSYTRM